MPFRYLLIEAAPQPIRRRRRRVPAGGSP